MNILSEGHRYELADAEGEGSQVLQFINTQFDVVLAPMEGGIMPLPEFAGPVDGTTNEEVLAVLIDRMNYLQGKVPCAENAIVISHLEICLMWLNRRTADRRARNVEGSATV